MKFSFLFIFFLFFIFYLYFFPSAFLLTIGMLPWLSIWLTNLYKPQHVALFNFNAAGVLPFLIDLWHRGHQFKDVVYILSHYQNWLIMYGSVALGYSLNFLTPSIIRIYLLSSFYLKEKKINKQLKDIHKDWLFPASPSVKKNKQSD